uniref:Bromo domain-containing protein n=1 Tax=Populus davidiana TaxID=266767 RepID=A0A6M2ERJ9_9ROSI
MGKLVEKTKKKKGRPSLLDLQKRSLNEQLNQQQQKKRNHRHLRNVSPSLSNSSTSTTTPNSSQIHKSATGTATPLRRSTRRNPTHDDTYLDSSDDEDNTELNGKRRREKKLKLVLKLPKPDTNSTSFSSTGGESNGEEEKNTGSNKKERKINASEIGKGDQNSTTGTNPTSNAQDSGPSTPLPDKKLLLSILDRLQKKDTYGVFSEPVDLDELPDYLEVIEHPMDFGTVRKKLTNGAYGSLELFEEDVFLICTNAMQYNAPDTIYFRQGRSIQELAKKNFENLRQDSDDNEAEPKVVRRGRPPSENFNKSPGRPSLDLTGSEFPTVGTLATGGENRSSEKSGFADSSGQFHGSRNEAYLSTDNRFERNDETAGSILKGKHSKKHLALDENRRNTYKQFHPSAGGRVPSVLTTFDAERKQLVAVGLLTEHGYARSVARFAANIGSFSWTIAVKRIEKSLAPGVKFGPGWVGENDIPPQKALFSSHMPSQLAPPPSLPPQKPFSVLESSAANATACGFKSKRGKLSAKPEKDIFPEKQVPSTRLSEAHLSSVPPSTSMTTSISAVNKCEPFTERAESVPKSNSHSAFNVLNSSTGVIRQRAPSQLHQNPAINPGTVGFNATYGFNLAAQMEKLIGVARPAGLGIHSSQLADKVSRTNSNLVRSANANSINSEKMKFPENSSSIKISGALPDSGNEAVEAPRSVDQAQPTWQGLYPNPRPDSGSSSHQKSDAVPPDLNVRYQSPGSPSSGCIDPAQPDLALQL